MISSQIQVRQLQHEVGHVSADDGNSPVILGVGGGINLNKSDFCDFVIIRSYIFTKKKSQAQIRVETHFWGPKWPKNG